MRARLIFLALVGVVVLGGLPAHALGAAERPTNQKLYTDGYDDRMLLGGQWLLKRDRLNVGQQRHFERQRGTAGWSPITVPNAWNAGDDSNESMVGGVAYYRKDFILPGSPNAATWVARFESVNYRATVYLNGKEIGEHTGAYLPFEFALDGVKKGVNRLVIRVDNVRQPFDFPPSGFNDTGEPVGGWWNYGGITREVYLRKVSGGIDYGNVQVRPIVNPGPPAQARVEWKVDVHNWGDKAKKASVKANFGFQKVNLGSVNVGGGRRERSRRTMRLPNPHLWSPNDPFLYPVHIDGTPGGYTLHIGVRSLERQPGRAPPAQRPAHELPRRRPARGLARQGLGDRQRHPRPVHRRDQGPGRDDDPHPLPALALPARAGGQERDPGVVGDPGLLAAQHLLRQAHRAPPGLPGARPTTSTTTRTTRRSRSGRWPTSWRPSRRPRCAPTCAAPR